MQRSGVRAPRRPPNSPVVGQRRALQPASQAGFSPRLAGSGVVKVNRIRLKRHAQNACSIRSGYNLPERRFRPTSELRIRPELQVVAPWVSRRSTAFDCAETSRFRLRFTVC